MLYELLTGQLPFRRDDPLEVIHSHIAKNLTPVHEVKPEIPAMLGAIVAKLMAKNAEDRYQSALGLQHDLQECVNQWQARGEIAEFALGQRDWSDRFIIPEKLYGRETEAESALVIVDLIPELERIIGPQPPASELSGEAAQNRFNLLFQHFIQVFRTVEYPLVIFIDALRFPGQLNQVFMNIFANAIDALEESNQGQSFVEIQANSNKVISTNTVVDSYVQISIRDNGKGISEEVKNKVFDHLCTTKEVGKGTGLGLAIAREIV